jgi:hypothetical protein
MREVSKMPDKPKETPKWGRLPVYNYYNYNL